MEDPPDRRLEGGGWDEFLLNARQAVTEDEITADARLDATRAAMSSLAEPSPGPAATKLRRASLALGMNSGNRVSFVCRRSRRETTFAANARPLLAVTHLGARSVRHDRNGSRT